MEFKCDLHSHSMWSDGCLTPEMLVDRAAANGVSHLALTDHDTLAGIEAAADRAKKLGLELITGVELSCLWEGMTIHVVGLQFDANHSRLTRFLKQTQAIRRARAIAIGEKLDKETGRPLFTLARELAGHDQITRTHFARVLIEQGLVKDFSRAFKRYLGRGKPAYVPSEWLPLEEAVGAIVDAGGMAVLAHPTHYQLGALKLQRLVSGFCDAGGVGIEVYTPNLKPKDQRRVSDLAQQFQLEASLGSDFHDPAHRWRDVGKLSVPESEKNPVWKRWANSHSRVQ